MNTCVSSNRAAEILGVEKNTLRAWRMQGRGPRYVKLTPGPRGRVVYLTTEVERWLAARTYGSTVEEAASNSQPQAGG